MAEGVVAIVAQGIQPLGDIIIQQASSLAGVGDQVKLAEMELELLQGFLKDADARRGESEVIRICVANIRDVVYDLEDVIGTFVLKVASRKSGSLKIVLKRFLCISKEGYNLYKIRSEIESITLRISQLRSHLQSCHIRESGGATLSQQDRRLTYPHVMPNVVGIEEDVENLVEELVRQGIGHRVVSIWGMGGSGKTTLAKHVFNHTDVKLNFDCFAWVCISQQCQGRDVLGEILIKLSCATNEQRQAISQMRKDEIAEKLCVTQREQKCLVIIDDIWTPNAWKSLEAGFPIYGETSSRILLTTRNKEVALIASRNGCLYQPRQLSDDQCWDLFEKIARIGLDDTNSEIYAKKKELGKEMLKECARLPLAIIVLAGLLSQKETVDEWETVHKNATVYIMRGMDLEQEEKPQEYEGVSWVLALSYDDLPYRLKLCFLYLGIFPEDYEISVTRLIQLWMAEGFIPMLQRHGLIAEMEDIAYGFLSELVKRCIVQVGNHGSINQRIKTCRLHDLMHDLCLLKAEDENFLSIVDFTAGTIIKGAPIPKVRRLAIYVHSQVDNLSPVEDERDGNLRSLCFFAPTYLEQKWNKKVTRSLFTDFKFLRVLKFEGIDRQFVLPSKIGNLVHLRFLSLKDSAFCGLPSSVSNLVCLQTLDLRGQFIQDKSSFWFDMEDTVQAPPHVFRNMKQLRHLYLPHCNCVSGKMSLATTGNLQTLVNVSSGSLDKNELVQLINLKKLYIWESWSGDLQKLEDVLISSMVTFKHLRSLSLSLLPSDVVNGDMLRNIVLRFPHLYKLQLCGNITCLPLELSHYPNLTKITLKRTALEGDQIKILEKLPKLRVLHLCDSAFMSEKVVFSEGGFPHLELLSLRGLRELTEWKVEKGAMPGLGRLVIQKCPKLWEIPEGLQHITTFKQITVNLMPSTFCSRVAEGGVDFYKIKHVPSLLIINQT